MALPLPLSAGAAVVDLLKSDEATASSESESELAERGGRDKGDGSVEERRAAFLPYSLLLVGRRWKGTSPGRLIVDESRM